MTLEYLRAGYRFGHSEKLSVVPVTVTERGIFDARHKLPAWFRQCPDFDASLRIKDRITDYRNARLKRIFGSIGAALSLVAADILPLAWGKTKPRRLAEKLRARSKARREASQLALKIDPKPGDVLFMPAWWHDNPPSAYASLLAARMIVVPLVHDALPLTMPHHYQLPVWFRAHFLTTLSMASHVMHVSRQTREDVEAIMMAENLKIPEGSIAYNGYNFSPSSNRRAIRDGLSARFGGGRINIIMVGSLEPKKNYQFVLDSCERLWRAGATFNLLIFGRKAWMYQDLVKTLNTHPRRNGQLFWFSDASDVELQFAYENADLCLSASLAEGFGLPVVEALAHKLPVVISDIPVYREIAAASACYFDPTSEASFTSALTKAMNEPEFLAELRAKAENFRWKSWEECGDEVFRKLKSLHDGQNLAGSGRDIASGPEIGPVPAISAPA